jgi:hypothetical protein
MISLLISMFFVIGFHTAIIIEVGRWAYVLFHFQNRMENYKKNFKKNSDLQEIYFQDFAL